MADGALAGLADAAKACKSSERGGARSRGEIDFPRPSASLKAAGQGLAIPAAALAE
jgi:hypothetical protein